MNRAEALSAAKWYKFGGRGLGTLSSFYYGYTAINNAKDGDQIGFAKALLDGTVNIVMTFGGTYGLVIGGTYFIIDSTVGWDPLIKGIHQQQENLKYDNYWYRGFLR